MAFDDRLQYLLLGIGIGFVLGYLVGLLRMARDIKEELDEVDSIVKELKNHEDEKGFMSISWTKIALFLIVGLTAYAAFVSQKASNDVKTLVERNEIVTYCNLTVTSDALAALNERSTYTISQTEANVKLQSDFAKLIDLLLHRPPYNADIQREAFLKYQTSLNNYVRLAGASVMKLENNPFPQVNDLVVCIKHGQISGNGLQQYLDEEAK